MPVSIGRNFGGTGGSFDWPSVDRRVELGRLVRFKGVNQIASGLAVLINALASAPVPQWWSTNSLLANDMGRHQVHEPTSENLFVSGLRAVTDTTGS